ncbi:MAG: flagellar filament capping protein FliD [Lachnospiraceae bacterium]|jgi:molecular chaperone GrpE (heat shock protein)
MSFMNFWNGNSLYGSNNSSTNLYSLFSERNAIKNGTYKKLLKSYYSSLEENSGSATSTSKRRGQNNIIDKLLKEKMYPTVSKETQEANTNLTNGIGSLKSSISTLQNENTFEDTENGKTASEKVVSAMKSYVNNYNNVVTASKSSTLSNKTAYVANMMSTTSKFEKELGEIGVMLKSDGTLQLDETKLKNTDLSKVQKLFSTDNIQSYGSTIASRVKFAGGGTSTTTGTTNDSTSTDDKKPASSSAAAALKTDGETLASSELFAKIKDQDGNEAYDIKKILSTAKSFVNNYNTMFDKAESSSNSGVLSNLSYIRNRTANNTKALKEFGISVDKKGRLSIDEETFQKADMSKVQDFFKDYGSYVASNASRVDYYMNTKANAASGYTSKASYNIPPVSDYNSFI